MSLQPRIDLGILADRLQRLARLDTSIFEEVRLDSGATIPAIFVLVCSTLLAGFGGWLWWWLKDYGDTTDVFVQSVFFGTIFSVALWIVWMLVTWVILNQVFREDADWQEMLRAMGMASAPLALSFFMFIPGIDFGIGLASIALFFGLTTIAVQSVTPANAARVLVANLAGFTVWAVVLGLLTSTNNYLAPGVFLFNVPNDILSDLSDAGLRLFITLPR